MNISKKIIYLSLSLITGFSPYYLPAIGPGFGNRIGVWRTTEPTEEDKSTYSKQDLEKYEPSYSKKINYCMTRIQDIKKYWQELPKKCPGLIRDQELKLNEIQKEDELYKLQCDHSVGELNKQLESLRNDRTQLTKVSDVLLIDEKINNLKQKIDKEKYQQKYMVHVERKKLEEIKCKCALSTDRMQEEMHKEMRSEFEGCINTEFNNYSDEGRHDQIINYVIQRKVIRTVLNDYTNLPNNQAFEDIIALAKELKKKQNF